ncbi:MAG: endonuclease MutS2 [Anaerolineales bacterium]|nr:endonuclease MutS2 [Anaerolineales bacterium]
MDEKTLQTLEYPKILERLAGYCAFNASAEKARALRPTADLHKARRSQAITAEAFKLLSMRPDTTIGGARDVREYAQAAARYVVLEPNQLLDIKYTLIAARNLRRIFEKQGGDFPHISEIALRLPAPPGLVDAISRTLSERGEVLDSASEKLANIRRELHIQHDRLLSRMQSMLSNPEIAPYLQDNLVTQRDGRYVIPLRADFKGKIKAVVHDSSSSGATLFVEPLSVVEHNNKYRELLLEERDEIRRVLAELSQYVGEYAFELMEMVETIAELDLAFSCAKYAEDLNAFEPVLVPFHSKEGILNPGVTIELRAARHPLLDQDTVVPIDMELDPQTYALIITGPNTGGKTVSLKTVGLLALMAQSGLHIPAQSGSQLSIFKEIYADIGDEQSIEQSLSTFSGHITNIIRILAQADRQSMVILDELGAGTDPQEGAALARAILTHLLERGITTLVTTHHPELKAYAHTQAGVVNASVEFDLESLKPTFHLTIGLPGRSNALAIAERLGLPETIVSKARAEINPTDLRAEDLLDEIHRQRELARLARNAAEKARSEAEATRTRLATRLNNLEDERRELLEEARQEAEEKVMEVRKELEKVRRELRQLRQPVEALQEIEAQIEELEGQVEKPVERRAPDEDTLAGSIRLGSKVRLRSLGNEGIVTALSEDEAEVQIGVLRIRARLSELELKGQSLDEDRQRTTAAQSQSPAMHRHESPGIELDLRGQRAEDALETLEQYVERAFLAKLPWVRVIHGKGTGKLRTVVREALSQHPHVSSFESGKDNEGGDGVTMVQLRG